MEQPHKLCVWSIRHGNVRHLVPCLHLYNHLGTMLSDKLDCCLIKHLKSSAIANTTNPKKVGPCIRKLKY